MSGGFEPTQAATTDPLLAYAAAERATLPAVLAQNPGLYSDVTVEGTVEDFAGSEGVPAGTYSVVTYNYTFADAMDWPTTIASLDGQASTIDSLCETAIFPAMRNMGVEGPLGVVYNYGEAGGDGPMWSHSCASHDE